MLVKDFNLYFWLKTSSFKTIDHIKLISIMGSSSSVFNVYIYIYIITISYQFRQLMFEINLPYLLYWNRELLNGIRKLELSLM